MRMRPTPRQTFRAGLAALICCGLLLWGGPLSQGIPEEKAAAGPAEKKDEKPGEKKEGAAPEGAKEGGEGKKEGGGAPAYKPGPPLDGYYDRNLLRYSRWVSSFRYPLESLHKAVGEGSLAVVQFSCALEFGSEAGMAEVATHIPAVNSEIYRALDGFNPQELLTANGKIRLKENMIAALNRRLLTARVRQVYLTEFLVLRAR